MENYMFQLRKAWMHQDGTCLSNLLSVRKTLYLHSYAPICLTRITEILPSPINDLAYHHIITIDSINKDDILQTYACHSQTVQVLVKILQIQKDENWMLPVMSVMCLELRLLALKVETLKSGKSAKYGETFEKCAECLMSCFRICAADNRSSEDFTKRWGMLLLVNQLLKVYFRINKLHLCKPLIRAIESSIYKDQFSLAQKITYKFFVGRKAMFDSQYKMADDFLSYAFQHCHKKSERNKRLILMYLIPVKILLGYFPRSSLLKKYCLLEFKDLIEAVRNGNLSNFEKVIKTQEAFLIYSGIYLIVEKLKMIAYRNLFKKVYLALKTYQIDISCLVAALEIQGYTNVDKDETECLVANLIYDGKIKGYISHQYKKLVVSKQNPFPNLSTLL